MAGDGDGAAWRPISSASAGFCGERYDPQLQPRARRPGDASIHGGGASTCCLLPHDIARTIRIALPRGRRRGSRLDAFDLNHACHPRQCADCRPYNQPTAAHVQTGASPLQTAAHRTPPRPGLCDSPMLARCSHTCALRDALPATAIGSRARARFPLWACGLHSLNAPDDEGFFACHRAVLRRSAHLIGLAVCDPFLFLQRKKVAIFRRGAACWALAELSCLMAGPCQRRGLRAAGRRRREPSLNAFHARQLVCGAATSAALTRPEHDGPPIPTVSQPQRSAKEFSGRRRDCQAHSPHLHENFGHDVPLLALRLAAKERRSGVGDGQRKAASEHVGNAGGAWGLQKAPATRPAARTLATS